MMNQQTNPKLEISKIFEMSKSSDEKIRINATQEFREILFTDNYDKDEIIQSGLVPKFVEFLQVDDQPDLQFEACWSLTNVAAGTTEETETVVDAGAIPILIKLISHQCEDLREQAVWALSNIIADCPKYRDIALKEEIMIPLLRFLWKSQRLSAIKHAVRTLANLCRPKNSAPDYEKLSLCIPLLSCMLFHNDEDILTDACQALADFSRGPTDNIRAIVDAGVCRRLVELLTHYHRSVVSSALGTLVNITASDDAEYSQMIIDLASLPRLLILLKNPKESTSKDICRMISNIALENHIQKQAIIDADFIPVVIDILNNGEIVTKREAAFVVTNLACDATAKQIKYIVKQGCIPSLLNMLNDTELISVVKVALTGLKVILQYGKIKAIVCGGYNSYAEIVKNYKGLDKIIHFKSHTNSDIRSEANIIIDRFFAREYTYSGIISEIAQQILCNVNIPA